MTREFQSYKEDRKLVIRMCRKADPESKGKIENVVKYIKHNFAKHRVYHGLDSWNEEGWKWLERTGNYKHHNTTKKRPVEVFALEKQHLRPISFPIDNPYDDSNYKTSITRSVRKDNTIWFKSNRYSVPLGTFNKVKQVYIEEVDDYLIIRETKVGNIIANHKIETSKGKLVQDTNHRRDRTKGIGAYIETVAANFSDKDKAAVYLQEIRKLRSRYIRDQLQIILKQIKNNEKKVIDMALEECMRRQLFSATEFIDMVQYLNRQREGTVTKESQKIQDIKPIHPWSDSVLQTEIHKRDLEEYVSVLEGDLR